MIGIRKQNISKNITSFNGRSEIKGCKLDKLSIDVTTKFEATPN